MELNNYTIGTALEWGEHALEDSSSTTPHLDAEVLLMEAAGLTKEDIFFDISRSLDESIYHTFERMIARRKNGEPVAYITGKKDFFGIEFAVDNCVLIPRPETEELVEKALDYIKDFNGKKLTILEIGTGSGAIAIAIAHSLKNWQKNHLFNTESIKIIATDISKKALDKAYVNAKKCKLAKMINFMESDLLEKIENFDEVDLIIANLPYLDPDNRINYSPEISEEPYIALYAGKNGLDCYKKMLMTIKKHKNKPHVIIECERHQKDPLLKIYNNLECIVVDD